MKILCQWKEGMQFEAGVVRGEGGAVLHSVGMDTLAPLGKDSAMTPKQLVLAGLCGCTAMDVVSLLKKHKQPATRFEVEADVESTQQGHPTVFQSVRLSFRVDGEGVSTERVLEAVRLSQTLYCGVSAMLSKAVPIHYEVFLNGATVGKGQANFK